MEINSTVTSLYFPEKERRAQNLLYILLKRVRPEEKDMKSRTKRNIKVCTAVTMNNMTERGRWPSLIICDVDNVSPRVFGTNQIARMTSLNMVLPKGLARS